MSYETDNVDGGANLRMRRKMRITKYFLPLSVMIIPNLIQSGTLVTEADCVEF